MYRHDCFALKLKSFISKRTLNIVDPIFFTQIFCRCRFQQQQLNDDPDKANLSLDKVRLNSKTNEKKKRKRGDITSCME